MKHIEDLIREYTQGFNKMDKRNCFIETIEREDIYDALVEILDLLPEDLGMDKVELSEITGGDAKENAEILLSVLKNEASPYLETTVLNAGLGFYANGKVASIKEGVELARQLIADGSALAKLQHLQEVQV